MPNEESLEAFVDAFATLGYERCEGDEPELGMEKIAIFANASGEPTHAARQMCSGMWTSKLGQAHDIAHELKGVSGTAYGQVGAIMRRKTSSTRE